MASNVYYLDTISGPVLCRRSVKQGRRSQPPELLQVRRVTINLTEQQYQRIAERAEALNMKVAAYSALAVSMFVRFLVPRPENA